MTTPAEAAQNGNLTVTLEYDRRNHFYQLRCRTGFLILCDWDGRTLSAGLLTLATELTQLATEIQREEALKRNELRCELCGHWFTELEIESGATHECPEKPYG